MKRLLSIFMTIVITLSIASCGTGEKGIIGTWMYSTAEDPDPDMAGVKIKIDEDTLSLIRNNEGIEYIMEMDYEKDDETIYVLSARGIVDDEIVETFEGDEFMEIPYVLSDDKLMLEMDDMGKIVMERMD